MTEQSYLSLGNLPQLFQELLQTFNNIFKSSHPTTSFRQCASDFLHLESTNTIFLSVPLHLTFGVLCYPPSRTTAIFIKNSCVCSQKKDYHNGLADWSHSSEEEEAGRGLRPSADCLTTLLPASCMQVWRVLRMS